MPGIIPRESNKKKQDCEFGHSMIRVWYRGAGKKRPARYLLKCGCCNKKTEVKISHGTIDIGGVTSSPEEWGRVLIPLLAMASSMGESLGRIGKMRQMSYNFHVVGDKCREDIRDVNVYEMSDKLVGLLNKEYGVVLPGFTSVFLAKLVVDLNNANHQLIAERHFEGRKSLEKMSDKKNK